MAIACDAEFAVFAESHHLPSITIPKELDHLLMTKGVKRVQLDNNNDVKEDDHDYRQPDDTDDDDYEEEDYNSDEDDKTESRWVGDKDRFYAFLYWLSGNECSVEDREEIAGSFNLLCGCFTAEDLLTDVRRSGLFSIEEIDGTVVKIISYARRVIKISGELRKDEYDYFGMLNNELFD